MSEAVLESRTAREAILESSRNVRETLSSARTAFLEESILEGMEATNAKVFIETLHRRLGSGAVDVLMDYYRRWRTSEGTEERDSVATEAGRELTRSLSLRPGVAEKIARDLYAHPDVRTWISAQDEETRTVLERGRDWVSEGESYGTKTSADFLSPPLVPPLASGMLPMTTVRRRHNAPNASPSPPPSTSSSSSTFDTDVRGDMGRGQGTGGGGGAYNAYNDEDRGIYGEMPSNSLGYQAWSETFAFLGAWVEAVFPPDDPARESLLSNLRENESRLLEELLRIANHGDVNRLRLKLIYVRKGGDRSATATNPLIDRMRSRLEVRLGLGGTSRVESTGGIFLNLHHRKTWKADLQQQADRSLYEWGRAPPHGIGEKHARELINCIFIVHMVFVKVMEEIARKSVERGLRTTEEFLTQEQQVAAIRQERIGMIVDEWDDFLSNSRLNISDHDVDDIREKVQKLAEVMVDAPLDMKVTMKPEFRAFRPLLVIMRGTEERVFDLRNPMSRTDIQTALEQLDKEVESELRKRALDLLKFPGLFFQEEESMFNKIEYIRQSAARVTTRRELLPWVASAAAIAGMVALVYCLDRRDSAGGEGWLDQILETMYNSYATYASNGLREFRSAVSGGSMPSETTLERAYINLLPRSFETYFRDNMSSAVQSVTLGSNDLNAGNILVRGNPAKTLANLVRLGGDAAVEKLLGQYNRNFLDTAKDSTRFFWKSALDAVTNNIFGYGGGDVGGQGVVMTGLEAVQGGFLATVRDYARPTLGLLTVIAAAGHLSNSGSFLGFLYAAIHLGVSVGPYVPFYLVFVLSKMFTRWGTDFFHSRVSEVVERSESSGAHLSPSDGFVSTLRKMDGTDALIYGFCRPAELVSDLFRAMLESKATNMVTSYKKSMPIFLAYATYFLGELIGGNDGLKSLPYGTGAFVDYFVRAIVLPHVFCTHPAVMGVMQIAMRYSESTVLGLALFCALSELNDGEDHGEVLSTFGYTMASGIAANLTVRGLYKMIPSFFHVVDATRIKYCIDFASSVALGKPLDLASAAAILVGGGVYAYRRLRSRKRPKDRPSYALAPGGAYAVESKKDL